MVQQGWTSPDCRKCSVYCISMALIWVHFFADGTDGCTNAESEALLHFKNSLQIDPSRFETRTLYLESWIEDSDCCGWSGVTCNNETRSVIKLDIQGGQLWSSIESVTHYLSTLHDLQELNLGRNGFEGETVLEHLCALHQLQTLDVSHNWLNGSIPSCIGNLSGLISLNLSSNDLTGDLPDSFSSLHGLQELNLGNNWIGGELSLQQLCALHNLRALDVSNNELKSSIPTCIGNLTGLTDLDLSGNYLTGGLPIALSDLTQLLHLDVSTTQRYGLIPEWLGSYSSLKSMDLSGNQFRGSIPRSFGNLHGLETLDVSDNHLEGHIPDELVQLTSLQNLDLSYNQLSGRIPTTNQWLTFSSTSFLGNPALCGIQLINVRGGDCSRQFPGPAQLLTPDEEDTSEDLIAYPGVGVGFVLGFLGVCIFMLWCRKARDFIFRPRGRRETQLQSLEGKTRAYGLFVFPQ